MESEREGRSELPESEEQFRELEEELQHLEEDVQKEGWIAKLKRIFRGLLGRRE